MKKTTPLKLTNRLARYSALSVAIAGIADANGQIIYTPVDPSDGTSSINNEQVLIDLDDINRLSPEFDLRIQGVVHLDLNPLLAGASVLGNPDGGFLDNYNYPFALNSGYVISSLKNTWISSISQTMVYNNCQYTGSDYNQWCDVLDRYLGLRFIIGANTHYGWARLNVGDLPNSWILKDYAYNDVVGASIMAGEGIPTAGINDNVFFGVKIVSLNKSIALFNLPRQSNYRLFSITGQSVLNGSITNNTHAIEANTLASGIYIIELQDAKTKAVMRKKIVL